MENTISAADMLDILDALSDGAAVNSWATQTCGGAAIRDGAREYFCCLSSKEGQPFRVARVTAYRSPWGEWRIGDVDIFTAAAMSVVSADSDNAKEIEAAVSRERHIGARCFYAGSV
jgi:hypothetical protein